MNLISQYVLRVGAYLIFSVLIEGILPKGNAGKQVRLVLGLIFIFALLQPVTSWLQDGASLNEMGVEVWADEERIAGQYENQAQTMVQEGYEKALLQQGLPPELRDRYRMAEVKIEDQIEVTLERQDPIGSLTDREFDLGQIGSSRQEKSELLQSLSAYWGITEEDLEMKLR